MHATTSELFLVAMLVIFTVPWLAWRLLRTDRIAPLVVVQIVGGILLGPGVLGAAFPQAYQTVFTPDVITALNGIAWWAVMIFVFIAGVELDLHDAWKNRVETGTTAGLALIVPLLVGTAAAAFLLQWPGWAGPRGEHWQVVLGIGMSCAVTALPILVLLMDKMAILRTDLGQRYADVLGHLDDGHPAQHVAVVAALVAARPVAADQALGLVEMQRRDRHAAAARHFTDRQGPSHENRP